MLGVLTITTTTTTTTTTSTDSQSAGGATLALAGSVLTPSTTDGATSSSIAPMSSQCDRDLLSNSWVLVSRLPGPPGRWAGPPSAGPLAAWSCWSPARPRGSADEASPPPWAWVWVWVVEGALEAVMTIWIGWVLFGCRVKPERVIDYRFV